MEWRRGFLLGLIMAACFYGNAAQKTGGYDYAAMPQLPAYQRLKDPFLNLSPSVKPMLTVCVCTEIHVFTHRGDVCVLRALY